MATASTQPFDARQAHPDRAMPRRHQIACFVRVGWNPYLRLLYEHLSAHGFELVERPPLSLRWLWRARRQVRYLHFHWPEGLYQYQRGSLRARSILSRLKLLIFAFRVRAARALGYRLIWTMHQPLPHDSIDPAFDRRAARFLVRVCHLVIAHDDWTADRASRELGANREQIAIVPHGSYVGAYPAGRSRSEVRRELGIAEDSVVFLCFGELRKYKQTDLLVEAFATASLPNANLVVAGHPKLPAAARALEAVAEQDPRIVPLIRYVPEEAVQELFHACDAAVVPRGDGGTSGSLVLALSFGLPVIAANVPTVRTLTRNGEAGWLFEPSDVASLRSALERASTDPDEARTRGRCALEIAEELGWDEIAAVIADLFKQIERPRERVSMIERVPSS